MTADQTCKREEVTAIVTAMTDGEKPFLYEATEMVLTDLGIGQVLICIDNQNSWIDKTLGSLLSDPRLEVLRLPLAPLPVVRNEALKYVRLPWIAWCDGDDVWCQGKTLKQLEYAESTGSDFVGTDHYLVNEDGKYCACALPRNIPMPSSWIIRTDIMKQYLFDPTVIVGSDGEWWIRTHGQFKKTRQPELLIRYRVRAGSVSSNTPSKRRKAKIVSIAKTPILRIGIFAASWTAWWLTRRNTYTWLNAWGTEPSSSFS